MLRKTKLAAFGHLQQCKKRGKNLPRLGVHGNDITPARSGAQCEYCLNGGYRAVDVECARDDIVDRRSLGNSKNSVNGGEQLGER